MNYWIILLVAAIGAVGGAVNAFLGDSGFHLPKTEDGVWQAGFLGVVAVGAVAAVGSWATMSTQHLIGSHSIPLTFNTGDIANALLIGFGGAKWFKAEGDKRLLQKTASLAAAKTKDEKAASAIAAATPLEALKIALRMT